MLGLLFGNSAECRQTCRWHWRNLVKKKDLLPSSYSKEADQGHIKVVSLI